MKCTVHYYGYLGNEGKKMMRGMSTCYIPFKGNQERKGTELCATCSKFLLFCHFTVYL